jgi:hypothetical protein
MFKILARINKVILPSFSKQQMDLAKAKNGKWQSLATAIMLQPCFTLIVIAEKNLIFLNFFPSVEKRDFHQEIQLDDFTNSSTNSHTALAVPPVGGHHHE